VDEVWEDVVADIDALVRIESVEDLEHAEPGKPWGPASYEALSRALDMAARLGLDAHDCEGYIGYADLAGASATQIATIAHTDVVPLGLGWTVPPLQVTRREGYLLGRGVIDDKGPFVLSLYAAHFFARQVARTGTPLPYTLRCIVGNCEETTMADLEWYLEHYDAPAFCFSPDADFPLICGEKGIFHGLFRSKPGVAGMAGGLLELGGGTVVNAIPGLATARLSSPAADCLLSRCTQGISSEACEDGSVLVTAQGVGGHAAFPEGTDNAIGKLVRLMLAEEGRHFAQAHDTLAFLRLVEQLTRTSDGSALGLAASDEVFGPLTLNAGVVRTFEDGSCSISVDVRYPRSMSSETLVATFQALAGRHGCTFEPGNAFDPFYMDPQLPPIQALLATYGEYRGEEGQPLVIGGGTYARHFPCACAFGPHDPSVPDPDWVGSEHGPDEGVSEEALRRALKVYIVSIARLMELELA
jgi:succinyl-diaminopimelate desuccinylase